jgi:hypothetical protein
MREIQRMIGKAYKTQQTFQFNPPHKSILAQFMFGSRWKCRLRPTGLCRRSSNVSPASQQMHESGILNEGKTMRYWKYLKSSPGISSIEILSRLDRPVSQSISHLIRFWLWTIQKPNRPARHPILCCNQWGRQNQKGYTVWVRGNSVSGWPAVHGARMGGGQVGWRAG